MKLGEWRRAARVELVLPSGLTVTVRRARLVDLAARGRVPAPLTAIVNEALAGAAFNAADVASFAEYGKLLDLVVETCVVEPPVAAVGDDMHLGLDEMALDDKTAIFNWAHGEGERLAGFRPGPTGDVAGGGDGAGVRPVSEPPAAGA